MPRPAFRPYSRYTLDAVALLGGLIRAARLEQRITAQALAERAGISRSLLQRIEKGDPRCELGATLEVASILGIPLFDSDADGLEVRRRQVERVNALLPASVHRPRTVVKDDF